MDLIEFISGAAEQGIAIYSARIDRSGKGYHFTVILDNLNSPTGSVDLRQCEEFSRRLSLHIDETIEAHRDEPLPFLPDDLNIENYSLEVTSAGVEREIRLPSELERFKGRPVKIRFKSGEDRERVEVALVVFLSIEKGSATLSDVAVFEEYIRKRSNIKKRSGRKEIPKKRLSVPIGDLIRANLYLDV